MLEEDFMVKLNVGGTMFQTTLHTLKESCALHNLAKGNWFEEMVGHKVIFIDRDSFLFRYVLLYLRTGDFEIEKHHLKSLKEEARYYMLPKLSEKIDKMMRTPPEPNEIVYELLTEERFKRFSDINICDQVIDGHCQNIAVGLNKNFILSIKCLVKLYNCPRGLKVHRERSNCGQACDKARLHDHEYYVTRETTMYLVSTKK